MEPKRWFQAGCKHDACRSAYTQIMGARPDRIGAYRILGVLGSGGMGVVYEAEHESIQRRAAIKVLHDLHAFDPDVTQRFFD